MFVAVLGASGMLYVQAIADQRLERWLMARVRGLETHGGVTVATTPDSLKSSATRACHYDPEINRCYSDPRPTKQRPPDRRLRSYFNNLRDPHAAAKNSNAC